MSVTVDYSVKYLTPEDLNVAASLIYQAYHKDPLMRELLQGEDQSQQQYEKKLRALIREELHTFWQSKQPLVGLFVEDRLQAIACVFASAASMPAQRYWHWRLKLMMSAGYLTTQQLIEKEQTIRNALQTMGNYLFIAFIAVAPQNQRHGLGHYLLNSLDSLMQEDNELKGMAVFVTQQPHIDFFTSHGFEVLQTLKFSKISGELLFKHKSNGV
ncbi:GNAT family N-acetyltransferase [Pseudoalteromonas sp. T1lg48]|uniref:GNAT family N-acetyltransferase n=1 Tax=Pseudoalteromonas sp. T1lg48 TaxID=2077100 RepID=UPI000CF706BF|nr:GNAT family N-acetyltransferase [Pseudoalteromonas sp. T1lg48]